jgi:chromosomal replication initiator protein
MVALWSAALPKLRVQLGERNFIAWIEPMRCVEADETLQLEVPSQFFLNWVEKNFLCAIADTVAGLRGEPLPVRLVLSDGERAAPQREPTPVVETREVKTEAAARAPRAPRIGQLVPHFKFDNFVVGPSNEMAFRTARSISEHPGKIYNPVVLHGGVGLGKTHLINAIAHELLRRRARVVVACLSAEAFMNQLITSLRQDQMNGFRARFRLVDALILDDIQFLAGKERTQEEFFHTFNALHGAQKQIVLTSDQPPTKIEAIEQRLRSRFEGGLIAEVKPPTREMRVEIVHSKAGQKGIELPGEVAEVLVRRSGASVRELEGALNRVLGFAAVCQRPITVELTEDALGPLQANRRPVSVEVIQKTVSQRFGVTVADLRSHRRGRQVSFPRQIAMYLSRTVAQASYPRIGEQFGGRDHSSVMYAVRIIEGRRTQDSEIDEVLAGIESELRDH